MATAQNSLDQWLEYKNKAADKQLEAEEFVSAYTQDEAKNALKEANRASSISYQQAINPYGYLAEQRRMRGLSSSGITGRQNTNQYTGYQQALGSNSANYIGQYTGLKPWSSLDNTFITSWVSLALTSVQRSTIWL